MIVNLYHFSKLLKQIIVYHKILMNPFKIPKDENILRQYYIIFNPHLLNCKTLVLYFQSSEMIALIFIQHIS